MKGKLLRMVVLSLLEAVLETIIENAPKIRGWRIESERDDNTGKLVSICLTRKPE